MVGCSKSKEFKLPSCQIDTKRVRRSASNEEKGEHTMAIVGVVMGSRSDWETMQHTCTMLSSFAIAYERRVVSAHRTPETLVQYAKTAAQRGLRVIVAGAGGAAHLPGMLAAMTELPVIGVPILSSALHGVDSLLSIVQMPAGIPVATVAIGTAGAKNAALLAARMLGMTDATIAEQVRDHMRSMRDQVEQSAEDLPFSTSVIDGRGNVHG